MRSQRTLYDPVGVARRGTAEHDAQRLVLLELVVTPPPTGDAIVELADTLGLSLPRIERALEMLVDAGLAERVGGRAFGTRAARTFDALHPARVT
jgi:DNA-binding IclR family transcriptional regulator